MVTRGGTLEFTTTGSAGSSSCPANNAVTPATKDGYTRRGCLFICWCAILGVLLTSEGHVDEATSRYVHELYHEG